MQTTKRQRRGLRLAVVSSILIGGGAAFVVWTMNRTTDSYLTDEVAHSFDAKTADTAPKPVPRNLVAPLQPQTSLTPIVTGLKPKAVQTNNWGDHPLVRDLVAGPALFLAKKTYLGKAEALEAFLEDRRMTQRWLTHPLIQGVLGDPRLLKWIVGPTVIQAFLSTPAMQDRKAVAALSKSELIKGIAKAPGVQALVQDPGFIQAVLLSPQAMTWMMQNPSAVEALKDIAPALAKAAGTTRR